jgi:hypothetical protein
MERQTNKQEQPKTEREQQIRKEGKRILELMKAKGPSLDKIGQVYVQIKFQKH